MNEAFFASLKSQLINSEIQISLIGGGILSESQNVEYKESWRDEYLKWVCGFANAQGGSIYIGVDDNGNVCGLKDGKKMLEDIPNKIRNTLGIVADVNLKQTEKGDFIEIVVEPQPYPISYYGEYHYRTGSTKQQLVGQQLNSFLMKKSGITWDSVPVSNVLVEKIRNDAFDIFKEQAVKNKRMMKKDVDVDNFELMENLNLIDENGYVKKAGVLLFHHNPEKWVPGSFIKIAYFSTEADIEYQDEIHGALLSQPDKLMDVLYTKYLKARVSYDGITRVEKYPFPKSAVREALLNAIAHKNYATLTPVQIRVYDESLVISNDCVFPEDWTLDDLLKQHKSRPYNPLIANAFYRAGFIESWGRGIQKIKEGCEEYNCPEPEYRVKKEEFTIVFKTNKCNEAGEKCNEAGEKRNEAGEKCNEVDLAEMLRVKLLSLSKTELSPRDKERLVILIDEYAFRSSFNGIKVSKLLNVSEYTARKLLRKAEKADIVESKGNTNNKKYRFKK